MRQAFIGVDVGTSSARAGVFDEKGTLLATARHSITGWHEAGSVVEQSSSETWAACAASVRAATAEAALPPSALTGIGGGATAISRLSVLAISPPTVMRRSETRSSHPARRWAQALTNPLRTIWVCARGLRWARR